MYRIWCWVLVGMRFIASAPDNNKTPIKQLIINNEGR